MNFRGPWRAPNGRILGISGLSSWDLPETTDRGIGQKEPVGGYQKRAGNHAKGLWTELSLGAQVLAMVAKLVARATRMR